MNILSSFIHELIFAVYSETPQTIFIQVYSFKNVTLDFNVCNLNSLNSLLGSFLITKYMYFRDNFKIGYIEEGKKWTGDNFNT